MAMHSKKINKRTIKISKNVPGSADYLSHYQKARGQIEAKLTDDQRQRYKAMAKEWSEKKLPPKMQRRYVASDDLSRLELTDFSASMMAKHGPRAIKEFTSAAYNQFGMRVVVLAAYTNDEGEPTATM
jgi:hypothetical protein